LKTEKKKIILIGGGGHCSSVIDVIEQENRFEIIGILDPSSSSTLSYPTIGDDNMIPDLVKEGFYFIISVGQIKTALVRKNIAQKLYTNNAKIATIISPYSYVSKHATIAEGTVVLHHALINASAKIGKHCIINSKANIEHGACIEDFCHISTGAIVNGDTKVGAESFIGSNAVLSNNIIIDPSSIISAGLFVK
jgi:sugar O-acyltransferase (sialic acid O-acetyltransferase NeuD family)